MKAFAWELRRIPFLIFELWTRAAKMSTFIFRKIRVPYFHYIGKQGIDSWMARKMSAKIFCAKLKKSLHDGDSLP